MVSSVLYDMALGAALALAITVVLVLKSLRDFSRSGPSIRQEILAHYRAYSTYAVARLAMWTLAICTLLAWAGEIIYTCAVYSLEGTVTIGGLAFGGIAGIVLTSGLQLCRHLLYLPASLAASMHYRNSRLYPLWRLLSPLRLRSIGVMIGIVISALLTATVTKLAINEELTKISLLFLTVVIYSGGIIWATWRREPAPHQSKRRDGLPNILMIGSDTLRADRLGAEGYQRQLTPNLDSLASRSTLFTHCYVPCARTAPSLVSLFTGTWPHTHGVRDNFVSTLDTRLSVPALPQIFRQAGYHTSAISDWAGSDLGKFPLGFESLDLSQDQWNLKYLIRQGPKDLRLFLSLFTHNHFGKTLLPEIYYLAGVPLGSDLGRATRTKLSMLARNEKPFLLNVFMATTHPPFGSEFPYYTLFSDPNYAGESKFVMARLTDPFDIIRRQGDSRKEFDLDQVIALYDGCVKNFDTEVERILNHMRACKLEDNTIVVIYSDHGMEFFEHNTWGQGNSVIGDYSPRVPLIISGPDIKQEGNLRREIVRSIDIAPTLLDMAGLAIPASMEGISLSSYLRGDPASGERSAYNETGLWLTDLPGTSPEHLRYPDIFELLTIPDHSLGTMAIKAKYQDIIVEAKDRMVRTSRWKLVYQPMREGANYFLFDVIADPDCRQDVASKYPEVAQKLKMQLISWMTQDSDRIWRGEHLMLKDPFRPE